MLFADKTASALTMEHVSTTMSTSKKEDMRLSRFLKGISTHLIIKLTRRMCTLKAATAKTQGARKGTASAMREMFHARINANANSAKMIKFILLRILIMSANISIIRSTTQRKPLFKQIMLILKTIKIFLMMLN